MSYCIIILSSDIKLWEQFRKKMKEQTHSIIHLNILLQFEFLMRQKIS